MQPAGNKQAIHSETMPARNGSRPGSIGLRAAALASVLTLLACLASPGGAQATSIGHAEAGAMQRSAQDLPASGQGAITEVAARRTNGELPWKSGASCSTGFAAWRGRELGATMTFPAHNTWQAIYAHISSGAYRTLMRQSPVPVVSLALLPQSEAQQFARCSRGAFDNEYKRIGAKLVQVGAGGAVIRLGWEVSRGGRRPWSPATMAQIPAYKACFRRAVRALRSTAPRVRIEWSNARKTVLRVKPIDLYPGSDVVDIIGLVYYDNFSPKITSPSVWNSQYRAVNDGWPVGMGAWLDLARSLNKKLAVAEWGIWENGSREAADNPAFIESMYNFFRANAGSIAYETYHNCGATRHKLYPASRFHRASAKYRELWGRR
jgi:beta-mannanase